MGSFLYWIVNGLLELLILALVITAVISWLVAFDIINLRNPTARRIVEFFDRITSPVLAPFRKFIPSLGGVDISFIVAFLVLTGIQRYILPLIFGPLIGVAG